MSAYVLRKFVELYGGDLFEFSAYKKSVALQNSCLCSCPWRFFIPIVIVVNLRFIPGAVKFILCVGLTVGLLVYLINNFALLISIDGVLAALHCQNTARKQFVLPHSFSVQRVEKRISRFGKKYERTAISTRPETLQYKSSAPMTVYSSGIEKVIATYHVELLDKNLYHLIVNSAKANANALKGKKKHYFLDKAQKNAPLNRVTVIVIYAKHVGGTFRNKLFNTVCKNGGDGFDPAVLPCVVDLEKRTCIFDSMRIPYMGFQYPVKNRGIKIIRKYLFNGKFPFADSPDTLDPFKDIDYEQSLWSFWKTIKKGLITNDEKIKKCFEKMEHGEIVLDDGYIYLKWKNNGILVSVELNEELKKAEIDAVRYWCYPKSHKIKKDTIKEIESLINTYFADLGYITEYNSYE